MPRRADLEPPELMPADIRFWVEGVIWIPGHDDERILQVDRLRPLLEEVGLTPMDQPAQETDSTRLRRRWTYKRVTLDFAHMVLSEYPQGISVADFAEELYRDETWTEIKQKAAYGKTQVVVHKLAHSNRLRKTYSPKDGKLILHCIGLPRYVPDTYSTPRMTDGHLGLPPGSWKKFTT